MGRGLLKLFGRDRRGVSAVEFALIAPLLILIYAGSVHVTLALSADRKLTGAASTVADLVAQNEMVDSAMLGDIFNAGRAVLQPFPAGTLAMRVTSIEADSDGTPQFVWSEGQGLPARSAGELPSLPAGVLLAGGGVVVVEARYPYETPFTGVKFGSFTFTETVHMRARRSAFVAFDGPSEQNGQGSQGGQNAEGNEGDLGDSVGQDPGNGNGRGRGRSRG
ncbi:MAG: TadE/TadG family type IV pilus assembly protein [Glycocaulis sp.]